MLIDHICVVFFAENQAAFIVRHTAGRLAMPIFAFLLVEGFFHTKSRLRYGVTLLVFAVISEPAFDLIFNKAVIEFSYQNVLFSLLLGLVMLCLIEKINYSSFSYLQYPLIAGFALLVWFLKTDHDISVIVMIAIFYYFRWHSVTLRSIFGCAAAALISGTPGTLLAVIPLCLYNQQRGRLNTFGKYFFYAFYPAHLILLFIIKHICT